MTAVVLTPPIFAAAADWAQARPFGCTAGQTVREVLHQLTGPPRVTACTLSASVPLELPGATEVRTTWPVTQPGVDVCFVIHPGELPPRIRSRMWAGPALFLPVRAVEEITPALLDQHRLLAARARILAGELHALALRYPEHGEQLRALAGLAPQLAPPDPGIAVIGPEADRCAALAEKLALHFEVRNGADVDAVVAVAPRGGWGPGDVATLRDAAVRVGRLVSTAPLPAGSNLSGAVARRDAEIPRLLQALLRQPRAGSVPEPDPVTGNWRRALGRLRRREGIRLDRLLNRCTQTSQLAVVAQEYGLGELPRENHLVGLEPVLTAVLLGLGAARLLWPLSPVLGMVVATFLGGAIGVVRVRARRQRRLRELRTELHRRWMEPDITSQAAAGPVAWLRHRLAVTE